MKTSHDPRHQHRIAVVKDLFAQSFHTQRPQETETAEIFKHQSQLDTIIAGAAPQWPIDKIAKIDLAILRLATYELIIIKAVPPKVIIDEAVELAKEFGGEGSAPFVNGVLGTVLKQQP